MNPSDTKELLAHLYLGAYVDNELAADERAQALARIEADASFKADACELRSLKERVRAAYADIPAAPVQAGHTMRAGLSQALVASLLLLVGIGAGWLAHDFSASSPAFERLAALPAGYQAIALTGAVDQNKIVLHLDSGEPGQLGKVLDLAEQLLGKHPAAQIEIVANSYGLNLLRADVTPLAGRIAEMAQRHANLSFVACGQTVARLKREGVKVTLLPQALTATSAINAIMTRMGQGWVYVKV